MPSISEDVQRLEPCASWWECKMVLTLQKTIWQILKKLNRESPYDPAILFLVINPKEPKTYVPTNT